MGCGSSSPADAAVSPSPGPSTVVVAEKRPNAAPQAAKAPETSNTAQPPSVAAPTKVAVSQTATVTVSTSAAPAAAAASAAPAPSALSQKFPKPVKKRNQTATTLEFSLEDVQQHNSSSSSWTIYRGYVYDITDFADSHPGGQGLLRRQAVGKDCTEEFDNYLHSESAFHLLRTMLIGKLKDPPVYKPNALGQYAVKAGLPSSLPEDANPPPISDTHMRYTENKSNHSTKDSSQTTKTSKPKDGTVNGRELTKGTTMINLSALKPEDSNAGKSQNVKGGTNLEPSLIGPPEEGGAGADVRSAVTSISIHHPLAVGDRDTLTPEAPVRVASAPAKSAMDDPLALIAEIQRTHHSETGRKSSIDHQRKSSATGSAPRSNSLNTLNRQKSTESPVLSGFAFRHHVHQPVDHHIYHFELSSVSLVTRDVKRFHFTQVNEPDIPKFASVPGQSILIRIPTESLQPFLLPDATPPPLSAPTATHPSVYQRPYTLISNEAGSVDLLIKTYPTGSVSRYMFSLNVGDKIETTGPRGRFFFEEYYGSCQCRKAIEAEKQNASEGGSIPPSPTFFAGHSHYRKWIFVCGGTGITPFYRLISAVLDRSADSAHSDRFPNCNPPELVLISCNKSSEDVLFRDELMRLAAKYPNFSIVHLLSRRLPSDTEAAPAQSEAPSDDTPADSAADSSSIASQRRNSVALLSGTRCQVEFVRFDLNYLKRFLPASESDPTLGLLCGPDGMVASIAKTFESVGFQRGCGNHRDIFLF